MVLNFIKRNIVLCIAVIAAAVTAAFVKPGKNYLTYFDYKTLVCLFCTLFVVCAFKNINFFYILSQKIVSLFTNARTCILALVYVTFIGSMLIANDMALITFLPLGFIVLTRTRKEKYMAFTFIMQNIAANLGGMLTPFGNPQNLYLYSYFDIETLEFIGIMFPPFIISISLITCICIVFVKAEPLKFYGEKIGLNRARAGLYCTLFVFSICMVFRLVPYYLGLVVILVCALIFDRKVLKMVDYPLLLTFVSFFIFSGNLSQISAVKDFFALLLSKSTLVFSVVSCQFISNVPSAILLSRFTENYRELLLGVNIGGCGTLIASLASLITFREYTKNNPGAAGSYIAKFSAFNFFFVAVLLVAESVIL